MTVEKPENWKLEDVEDVTFEIQGDVRVTIEYLGEGWSGDYNEDDASDEPLLRFTATDLKHEEGAQGYRARDSSYCTAVAAWVPKPILQAWAMQMALELKGLSSWKRTCEAWSWTSTKALIDSYGRKVQGVSQ